MKKLLSLLSALTVSGATMPTIIATSPYQKQENINSDINYLKTNNLETLNRNKRSKDNLHDQDTIINLNQLKTNDSNIDLNHLNKTSTENDIKDSILVAIASKNDSKIYDIIISILTKKEKWKISGINFVIPNAGESYTYDAKFLSLDSSKYIGVLSAKITLSNLKNLKNLKDVILNKNLGSLNINDDIESIKKQILIVLQKNNLDIREIEVQDITYENATIKSLKNSSKYFGSVILSFNVPKITLKAVQWDSAYISLSSYRGPETKTSEKKYEYDAVLGKEAFLKKFKKIKIKFSGDSITSRPQWVEKFFRDETKLFDISSDYNKQFFWYDWKQWYGNFDASAGWLEMYWSANKFILKAVAYIKVDSSAISTDYSRAKAQLTIKEISFE